jgi:hypothetical protein
VDGSRGGAQWRLRPLLVSNRYEGHLAPIDACQLLKLKIDKARHQGKGSRELNIDFRFNSHLKTFHPVPSNVEHMHGALNIDKKITNYTVCMDFARRIF